MKTKVVYFLVIQYLNIVHIHKTQGNQMNHFISFKLNRTSYNELSRKNDENPTHRRQL